VSREQVERGYRRRGVWGAETLPGRLARVRRSSGGRVALNDGANSVTFDDFFERVRRVAGRLAGMDVGPGDVVSWQLPNWWEAAVVHHAALQVGAIPNPLNMIFRGRELRFVLAQAKPTLLVVPQRFRRFDHASLASKLRDEGLVGHVVVARGDAPGCDALDDWLEKPPTLTPPAPPGAPSDPALLLYTSGTTSDPKGVVHTHETLLYEIDSLRDIHRITPADCYLGGSPVTHIAGLVYGILMPFALATRTAFLDRWDAGAALALIERERASFQTGAPTFLQTLADHPDARRRDLSSFRLFSTGGANIPTEPIRAAESTLGCTVKRAYGSTEVPTLTATSFDDPDDARLGTDGRAIGEAEMRIVETNGADVRPGEEGEIWARSPEVFRGYRNPALDEEAFDADGWFRTGDLGRVDADGYLRVTGRLKDVIIRGGENVSVKELEDLLAEHPAVADVAIVGMPDPLLGERVAAFVAPRRGSTLAFSEMIAWLEAREIAKQKLPERLEVRPRLPKTASGKVQKAALRAELMRGPRM
jgi:non-ribosomal peptide synthetase component E (peptide arylation enzyme)